MHSIELLKVRIRLIYRQTKESVRLACDKSGTPEILSFAIFSLEIIFIRSCGIPNVRSYDIAPQA